MDRIWFQGEFSKLLRTKVGAKGCSISIYSMYEETYSGQLGHSLIPGEQALIDLTLDREVSRHLSSLVI